MKYKKTTLYLLLLFSIQTMTPMESKPLGLLIGAIASIAIGIGISEVTQRVLASKSIFDWSYKNNYSLLMRFLVFYINKQHKKVLKLIYKQLDNNNNNNQETEIKKLLETGVNPNYQPEIFKISLLSKSILSNVPNITQLLLKYGADCDDDKARWLYSMTSRVNTHGYSPRTINCDGYPLLVACSINSLNSVKLLTKYKTKKNPFTDFLNIDRYVSPISLSLNNKNYEIFNHLMYYHLLTIDKKNIIDNHLLVNQVLQQGHLPKELINLLIKTNLMLKFDDHIKLCLPTACYHDKCEGFGPENEFIYCPKLECYEKSHKNPNPTNLFHKIKKHKKDILLSQGYIMPQSMLSVSSS